MYAFGVFMWQLMTCLLPFDGAAPDLIAFQVKSASLLQCIIHAMQAASGQPNYHVSKAVAAMVNLAAQFVSSSASVQQLMRQHQLTDMQAQTVCLYTLHARQHGGLRQHSVFYVYNAALRWRQAEAVALCSQYWFLFCSALDKLPSVTGTVFRGLHLPLTQLTHMYSKGSTVWLNSVTSTTTDQDQTLLQFGAGACGRPATLLHIIAVDAKDMQAFSPFPEGELLIPPNSCHTVHTVLQSAEVQALPQFGSLPVAVHLVVMRQDNVSAPTPCTAPSSPSPITVPPPPPCPACLHSAALTSHS